MAKAQSIARATAGAIAYEDDGRVSVLFPPPGAVTAPPAAMLAREDDGPAAAPAPAPTPAAAPAAAAPAPAGATLDRDELYQDFMRRLRRDVLEQREQLGELF
jgi:pyruvate/2-oxoglutarate dehydrogenase complex dihydrolipoamide acyltransferase (E2) component